MERAVGIEPTSEAEQATIRPRPSCSRRFRKSSLICRSLSVRQASGTGGPRLDLSAPAQLRRGGKRAQELRRDATIGNKLGTKTGEGLGIPGLDSHKGSRIIKRLAEACGSRTHHSAGKRSYRPVQRSHLARSPFLEWP